MAAVAIAGGSIVFTYTKEESGTNGEARGFLSTLADAAKKATAFPTVHASFFGDILSKRDADGYEEGADGTRVRCILFAPLDRAVTFWRLLTLCAVRPTLRTMI